MSIEKVRAMIDQMEKDHARFIQDLGSQQVCDWRGVSRWSRPQFQHLTGDWNSAV